MMLILAKDFLGDWKGGPWGGGAGVRFEDRKIY